jgi:hypothetical protein
MGNFAAGFGIQIKNLQGFTVMRKIGLIVSLFAVLALTSGCESARKAFGGKKNAPDEFVVYSRPPLSLPPDYGLRPPKPGISRPQKIQPSDVAREAILGKNQSKIQANTATTPGLQAMLRDTGAIAADPAIRDAINQETSILAVEDQQLINKLIFWVDDQAYQGTVVDPEKESKRLREAQALGKSVTETDTVHVKRKRAKKGLLDF